MKISFDAYGSKIRKVSRHKSTVLHETILATKQEFFFKKVVPVQSITDIVLLDFWLILLPWMFVSYYTTIYFFVMKFFFECLYFSEYDIRMFLFLLWLRNRPSISTYATGEMEGVQPRGMKNHSEDMYVLNEWPQTNVVEYFLCTGSVKYTRASPPARKMSLFSFIIITIILSYAMIRISSPSPVFES